nr:hypothetical protein [Suaeda aralocaspica]
MEVSMFNDMGMMNDLSFLHQLQVNSIEDLFVNNYDQVVMTNQTQGYKRFAQNDVHTPLEEKPTKQLKANNWSYEINHVLNSQDDHLIINNSPTMLSFSNNSSSCSNQTNSGGLITPKDEVAISNVSYPSPEVFGSSPVSSVEKQNEASPRIASIKSTNAAMSQQSRDHIMAERKRREKLSQKFIALSAIIPGLKKMDKASVLGDAIKYVKQLQERVTKLEGEAKKKPSESAVLVKRSYVSVEQDDQISGGSSCDDGPLPEIEAKFSDKDVLIKIHCEKIKGVVEKIISKIEELNLVVNSSSSLAFGGSTLAVTITAQMNAEFSMTAKDVIKHIHTTLKCLA